jgi:hypothetical protein
MRSSNTAKVSSKRRSICARRSCDADGPLPPAPDDVPAVDARAAPLAPDEPELLA